MLVGCSLKNENKIKGHWIIEDESAELYLNDDEFNSMKVINAWGVTTGTYEVENDTLKISYSLEEKVFKYKLNGDTLELYDPNDSSDIDVFYRADDND